MPSQLWSCSSLPSSTSQGVLGWPVVPTFYLDLYSQWNRSHSDPEFSKRNDFAALQYPVTSVPRHSLMNINLILGSVHCEVFPPLGRDWCSHDDAYKIFLRDLQRKAQ
jgi:hypothetical protein